MSTQCTENSTECLLQQIQSSLEELKNEYNWDPLSVGITAVIGILALAFTIVTILQGMLAAGPGRLKASKMSIGPYSRYSRSAFSFTEFRVRTRTKVPLLRQEDVLDSLIKSNKAVDMKEDSNDDKISPLFKNRKKGRKPTFKLTIANTQFFGTETDEEEDTFITFPTTGWLTLLHILRLTTQDLPLISQRTDYLPADLYASHAFGEIRCLLILAAISGCSHVEMVEKYPRAQGDQSQLYFRDHPQLGVVAVYEKFSGLDGSGGIIPCIPVDEIIRRYNIAYGSPYFGGESFGVIGVSWATAPFGHRLLDRISNRLKTIHGEALSGDFEVLFFGMEEGIQSTILSLLFSDIPDTVSGFPCENLQPNMRKILAKFCHGRPKKYLEQLFSRDKKPGYVGDVARISMGSLYYESPNTWARHYENTEGYLEKKKVLQNDQQSIFTNWLFSENYQEMSQEKKFEFEENRYDKWNVEKIADLSSKSGQELNKTLLLEREAFEIACTWLFSKEKNRLHQLKDFKKAMDSVTKQLEEVDYWLGTLEKTPNVVLDLLGKLEAEDEDYQEKNDTDQKVNGNNDENQPEKKGLPKRWLTRLVIYRMVLMGTLLSSGADTSSVVETDLGRRVVPFI